MDTAAATTTADLVLDALRTADRPLTVTEVRQRVRATTNIVLHRTTVSSALKRNLVHSRAAYDLGDDDTQRWYALP